MLNPLSGLVEVEKRGGARAGAGRKHTGQKSHLHKLPGKLKKVFLDDVIVEKGGPGSGRRPGSGMIKRMGEFHVRHQGGLYNVVHTATETFHGQHYTKGAALQQLRQISKR